MRTTEVLNISVVEDVTTEDSNSLKTASKHVWGADRNWASPHLPAFHYNRPACLRKLFEWSVELPGDFEARVQSRGRVVDIEISHKEDKMHLTDVDLPSIS